VLRFGFLGEGSRFRSLRPGAAAEDEHIINAHHPLGSEKEVDAGQEIAECV
jgi:hypothetical protein